MFEKIKENWRTARAETLCREVEDIILRLNNANNEFSGHASLAMANMYVSINEKYGLPDKIPPQGLKLIVKKVRQKAREIYYLDDGQSAGLFLISAYFESLSLSGPKADFIKSTLEEMLDIALKIKERLNTKSNENNSESQSDAVSNSILPEVQRHLEVMGYDLLPYGCGVAVAGDMSGYSPAEVASHIALTTLALDISEAKNDLEKAIDYAAHGSSLINVLTYYKDEGFISEDRWKNDGIAILGVTIPGQEQERWLETILTDPIAGKERLARSRIKS